VLAAGFAPTLAALSTSCLFSWTKRAVTLDPPAGDAPAGSLYKSDPQAAAWRRKWSQSPVLPRTWRAYETHVSAGSTAVLADGHQNWSPHPELHRASPRVPGECVADNALRASRMIGARRLARPRLPDPKSGGSAIPREPRADEIGVPDRLRSGDLLHERQACWLDYTTGTEIVRAEGFAPSTWCM
jgi:hypothetical protein